MSTVSIEVIIALVGVLISILSSVYASGKRNGIIESKMDYMNDRLAKIEGMFTLTIRQEGHSADK